MERPVVNVNSWIKIKSDKNSKGIDGYVFNIFSDGTLAVGYHQNNIKAIKTEVIWSGCFWKFKHSGPDGSYLRGPEEAIVKRGPNK